MDGPDSEHRQLDRLSLLQEIVATSGLARVSVDAWALLWTCDIHKLRDLVSQLDQPSPHMFASLRVVIEMPHFVMFYITKPWMLGTGDSVAFTPQATLSGANIPRGEASSTPPRQMASTALSLTQSASQKASCDRKLAALAHERDKGCIVIKATHHKNLQGAHIYPISMIQHLDDRSTLWTLLKTFFSDEDVASWEATLFQGPKAEKLENMVTMSHTVHKSWDLCQFALLPIETNASKTAMRLRFFWLRVRNRGDGFVSLTTPPDLPAQRPSGPGNLKFWNCDTELKVKSGDTITLTTHDPVTHPLPSEGVLRMQWHLNRIAALAGGAEILDASFDDNGSCVDSDYGTYGIENEQDSIEDEYESNGDVQSSSSSWKPNSDPFRSANVALNPMSH